MAGLAAAFLCAPARAQVVITNTFTFTFATGGAPANFNSSWVSWYNAPGNNTHIPVDVTMDASNNAASGSLKVVSPLNQPNGTQNVFFGTFASNVNNAYDFSVGANLTLYSNISFDIRVAPGTPLSGSGNYGSIGVGFISTNYYYEQFGASVAIPASASSQWVHLSVPIVLTQSNLSNVPGLAFDINSYSGYPLFTITNWIDNISANSAPIQSAGPNPANVLIVDAASSRAPISSQIYGTAFATASQLSDLNFTMNRSGGNEETTYNWQINAHGKGADNYFESYPDASATPGESADTVVSSSKSAGAQALITVPMIGWTPILGPGRAILPSYSVAKYGPQKAVDPYHTNCGNGISVTNNTPITWNDPTDAYTPSDTNFEAGYIRHLTSTWGVSTNGGVGCYIMDNEHSLWHSTHQDIHPTGATMQEIFGKMVSSATMVKSLDPHALVLGPEEWGWPGYLYSGYDQQWSGKNGDYNTADFPDRTTNGGWDYMPWLLHQFQNYNATNGQRLLDYFTLHCYPQEGDVGSLTNNLPETDLLRNQTTRQLWDSNYVDPSWIDSVIMLIPRMKSWVAEYYPGTKIGITEYNWGAEAYMSGATAQADLLGIFGRQGLDLATRWTTPATGSPTYLAMKMYRNYDGHKSTFGETSVGVLGGNPDNVALFAAQRSADEALTIMAVSKYLTGTVPLAVNVANFIGSGTAQVWQLKAGNAIAQLSSLPFTKGTLQTTVPGQSVTLFVLPPNGTLRMSPGPPAAAGQFSFTVTGETGRGFILQSSTDLAHWTFVSSNTFASASASFQLPAGASTEFYRTALTH
jgi:hypothetical protein